MFIQNIRVHDIAWNLESIGFFFITDSPWTEAKKTILWRKGLNIGKKNNQFIKIQSNFSLRICHFYLFVQWVVCDDEIKLRGGTLWYAFEGLLGYLEIILRHFEAFLSHLKIFLRDFRGTLSVSPPSPTFICISKFFNSHFFLVYFAFKITERKKLMEIKVIPECAQHEKL